MRAFPYRAREIGRRLHHHWKIGSKMSSMSDKNVSVEGRDPQQTGGSSVEESVQNAVIVASTEILNNSEI